MDENTINELKQGMETAFINRNVSSNLAYKPEFIFNNYEEGRKVLSSLEEELLSCEEFNHYCRLYIRNSKFLDEGILSIKCSPYHHTVEQIR